MKKTIKLMNRIALLGVFTFLSLSVFGQSNATPTKHKIRKMTATERAGHTPSTTTEATTTTTSQEVEAPIQKKATTAKMGQQRTLSSAELAKKKSKVETTQARRVTTKPANQVAKELMNELKNVPVNERASFLNKKLETTTDEQERAWLKRALMKYKQQ